MLRRLAVLLAVLAPLALPASSLAAGETTHAWMVDRAIEFLPAGPLKQLLETQRLQALAGAAFPDTGYWVEPGPFPMRPDVRPSDDFGEISHWERFIDAYVAHIRAAGCGDLTDPAGPCASMIAHLMGSAGHGLGDELWDWMFEPAMADHGEDPAKNFFAEGRPGGPLDGNPLDDASSSPEYAMDVVAVWRHGQLLPPQLPPPPVDDLVQVYADIGRDVTPEHILAGHAVGLSMISAEHAVAPEEGPRVEEDMPWSASHFVTEPGGVDDLGHAIDGYFEALWHKLLDATPPPPEVTHSYPSPGADDVPFRWLPARTSPGPYGGGSRNRIVAVMSNAVDGSTVTASAFRLLDASGQEVPQLEGFPRAGPYGSSDGTHAVMLYPAEDLRPCARYTVEVTPELRDFRGAAPLATESWSFRTTGCI